jgi:hypothetical protein
MHTTDGAVASPERRMAGVMQMLSFAAGVAEAKRATAGDDIASTLVHAAIHCDRLTDGEPVVEGQRLRAHPRTGGDTAIDHDLNASAIRHSCLSGAATIA